MTAKAARRSRDLSDFTKRFDDISGVIYRGTAASGPARHPSSVEQIAAPQAGVHREAAIESDPFAAVFNRERRVIGIRNSIPSRLAGCEQSSEYAPMAGPRPQQSDRVLGKHGIDEGRRSLRGAWGEKDSGVRQDAQHSA